MLMMLKKKWKILASYLKRLVRGIILPILLWQLLDKLVKHRKKKANNY